MLAFESQTKVQIAEKDKKHIFEYLKNIWTVRKFFLNNYGTEPTIINRNQMPLHQNKSSSQKTLNLTEYETYVTENYNFSREQVTVFTQVINDPTLNLKPELAFKEKRYSNKINTLDNKQYQWTPKGYYKLKHMLKTFGNFPNSFHMFSAKNYAIYDSTFTWH